MLRRSLAVIGIAVCTISCRDGSVPVDPITIHDGEMALHEFGPEEGPTQEQYDAAGQPNPSLSMTPITGLFNNDKSSWISTTKFSFQWTNSISATLDMKVVDNGNGATLNEGGDSYTTSAFIWNTTKATIPMGDTISTLNHTCGITGKARFTASAALKLIENPTKITSIWTGSLDRSPADVTLPNCESDPCDDPYTDEVEPCGPDGPPSGSDGVPSTAGGSVEEQTDTITVRCWYEDHYIGDIYLGRVWTYCERIG